MALAITVSYSIRHDIDQQTFWADIGGLPPTSLRIRCGPAPDQNRAIMHLMHERFETELTRLLPAMDGA